MDPPEDLAEAPLPDPFAALKTESLIAFFFPAHFGQAISCVLFNTIFSKCVWQSSQMYSYIGIVPIFLYKNSKNSSTVVSRNRHPQLRLPWMLQLRMAPALMIVFFHLESARHPS